MQMCVCVNMKLKLVRDCTVLRIVYWMISENNIFCSCLVWFGCKYAVTLEQFVNCFLVVCMRLCAPLIIIIDVEIHYCLYQIDSLLWSQCSVGGWKKNSTYTQWAWVGHWICSFRSTCLMPFVSHYAIILPHKIVIRMTNGLWNSDCFSLCGFIKMVCNSYQFFFVSFSFLVWCKIERDRMCN